MGCTTGPILKTGWATGPVPLRGQRTEQAELARAWRIPHTRPVPHLRLIDVSDATGALRGEYDAALARAGKVFNIVKSMSLRPPVLRRSMQLYREIMFEPSGLSRQERELLATVVSRTNECFY